MQHIKSGFSLIELLIVVAIIGILAAIGTVDVVLIAKRAYGSQDSNNCHHRQQLNQ